ncbi:MAG: PEP/pyruvate-binding domain-containing protein [Nitrospiria bacterium]
MNTNRTICTNENTSTARRQRDWRGQYLCLLRQAKEIKAVGGKAYHLGCMLRDGIAVPPAFVITNSAFQFFLDCNDLRKPIKALCFDLDVQDPECFRKASKKIKTLVLQAKIPESLHDQIIRKRNERLPGVTLIIRSSAVGEDSEGTSFAGQLDSLLNINSNREINEALLSCWASYWSERSLFYQLSRGISLNGMAVVIQEMIRSRVSGVLFTKAPGLQNSECDLLLGEYCFGLGEALVSGRINPGRFAISRASFQWKKECEPEQIPDPSGDSLLFNEALIASLARMALDLEQQFGAPQDIEWTLDQEGKLYIVQARPITEVLRSSADSDQPSLVNENQGKRPPVIWSNANVCENFPEPISPLLYSIASTGYYYYFRNLGKAFGISLQYLNAMEHPLRHIIGIQGARMYYNLTNIHTAIRQLPFGERLTEYFNLFVGASQTTATGHMLKSKKQSSITRLLKLVRIAVATLWQYLFLSKRVETFERSVSEFSEATLPMTLGDRSLFSLLENFRAFLEIRFHRWTNAGLADVASMVGYGALKKLLNDAFPEANQASLHNTLLKGLPGIVSSIPALKIWELSRQIRENESLMTLFTTKSSKGIFLELEKNDRFVSFQKGLNDFLDEWGFRCSGELMLTIPSFQEDPIPLIDILKGYLSVDAESPAEVMRQQGAERVAETERVVQKLSDKKNFPFLPLFTKGRLIKIILNWTHRAIALRERARLKQALLYSRCRRIVLAMGEKLSKSGHLEHHEDIFFLTYEELDALISRESMLPVQVKDLVEIRKKEHAVQSAMSVPDTLVLREGDCFTGENQDVSSRSTLDQEETPALLSGIGACGGQVTGRATILQEVTESRRLGAGDVLVTRQTDPGWGPVFFLIRGLVLERGGMLSHGAIIAREYGIPCVVGVQDATRRIPEGEIVSVDGDRGDVRLLD